MRVAGFCSGIGLLEHAFDAAGGETVFACELNAKARACYLRNWTAPPGGFASDMLALSPEDVPPADIYVAGLPCQPFSRAGIRMGSTDERHLFPAFLRLLEANRPQLALIENVPGLLDVEQGRTYRDMLAALRALGYHVSAMLRDAMPWLPMYRKRIFILAAMRPYVRLTTHALRYPERPLTAADVLEPDWLAWDCVPSGGRQAYLRKRLRERSMQGNHFIHLVDERSPFIYTTVKNYQGHNGPVKYIADGRLRMLTPREIGNLMGVPQDFVLPERNKDAYELLGNSVAFPVVQAIAAAIQRMVA